MRARLLLAPCLLLAGAAHAQGLPVPGERDDVRVEVQARESHPLSDERLASLERACSQMARALGGAKARGRWRVEAAQARSIDEFVERTGRARFEAAAMKGGTIWLMPETVLARFSTVEPILAHECVHAWLFAHGLRGLPLVVEEALALGLSGQARRLPQASFSSLEDLEESEAQLAAPKSRRRYEEACAKAAGALWPVLAPLAPEGRRALLERLAAKGRKGWLDVEDPDGHGSLAARLGLWRAKRESREGVDEAAVNRRGRERVR